ncbi:MAG TPA: DUF2877 domain-containing protein [Streptosporangiaceae bacterium]|nr:DUF2877 domain-containing protein [Streptosporangiaceae bacterium]
MRLDAAACTSLRAALACPARPATWLGTTTAALYLATSPEPGVLAVLAHDAVRLPFSVLLPTTAAELPLTSVGDRIAGAVMAGDGCLAWTGPAGPVIVRVVREWAPARVRHGAMAASALALLRDMLPAPADLGIDGGLLNRLLTEPAAAVAALLGRGPGLTPAGDDALAGFLLGARAVGLDATGAAAAVATMASARTTALSAALLWHAARGECIDEVAAVVAKPSGPVMRRLLRIGHSSGAALATGLMTAALPAWQAGEAA